MCFNQCHPLPSSSSLFPSSLWSLFLSFPTQSLLSDVRANKVFVGPPTRAWVAQDGTPEADVPQFIYNSISAWGASLGIGISSLLWVVYVITNVCINLLINFAPCSEDLNILLPVSEYKNIVFCLFLNSHKTYVEDSFFWLPCFSAFYPTF